MQGMRGVRLLFVFFLISIMFIGVSGCMISDNVGAVEYLENKYNEEFVGIDWYDTGEYRCYPVSNKDQIVRVFHEKEDGKISMKDDYYGWLIKDEYMELTNSIVRQWFPDEDIKMFSNFTVSFFEDEYTAVTPLADAMANEPRDLGSNVWIFVAEDEWLNTDVFESKCVELVKSLKDSNYHTGLIMYAVQREQLNNIDKDNYPRYFLRNQNSREFGFLFEFRKNVKSIE